MKKTHLVTPIAPSSAGCRRRQSSAGEGQQPASEQFHVRQVILLTSIVLNLTAFSAAAIASKQAHGPSVPDGATNISENAVLGWSPGDFAQLHHVFLSTDYNDVADRLAYQAAVHGHDNCRYDPGPLLLGYTYYWAIYEQFGITITPGQPWQFKVQQGRPVEDMESYSNATNYIFDTWLDGAGDITGLGGNGTGSIVDLSKSLAHAGSQSMRYGYNNTGNRRRRTYSEAECTFDAPQNWVCSNEKALVLRFFGSTDNDAESMYVALDDGSATVVSVYGALGEDPNDVKTEKWQEWNIDLQEFVRAGLDLSNVVGIAIGFGDRNNPLPGGSGVIHFDDIKLYPTRCAPRYGPPGDLSGDCIVDAADIAIMAGEWLNSDFLAADLHPDNRVDFRDYAVLLNGWLEKRLWPQP